MTDWGHLTLRYWRLGHRRKEPKNGEERFEPPGVFQTAWNQHDECHCPEPETHCSKIIERRFRDVKDSLSRLLILIQEAVWLKSQNV